ncbi:MAG: hypothetical protein MUC97_02085 [Bernardetiaceae bacterium]|jgi:hypothetical protein|nr:hypothetical protein [Bernardetiaceae bacterium]
MQTELYLADLLKFQLLEQTYQLQHPEAEPLSRFYPQFGLTKLLLIAEQARGRRIVFKPQNAPGDDYAFE